MPTPRDMIATAAGPPAREPSGAMRLPGPPGSRGPIRQPGRALFPPSFAPHRPLTATGDGERTGPIAKVCWTYHVTEGFKGGDNPLGPLSRDQDFTPLLVPAGFHPTPSFVIRNGDDAPVWLEVYERPATAEHLVVVVTPVVCHFILARGFPSLLDVVGKVRDLVNDAGKSMAGGPTSPPEDDPKEEEEPGPDTYPPEPPPDGPPPVMPPAE